jgi:hypothetical protein
VQDVILQARAISSGRLVNELRNMVDAACDGRIAHWFFGFCELRADDLVSVGQGVQRLGNLMATMESRFWTDCGLRSQDYGEVAEIVCLRSSTALKATAHTVRSLEIVHIGF